MSDSIMPPSMGGKYKAYIDQLVKTQETRRVPLEERLETSQLQKSIWQTTNKNMSDLQNSLKRLFGLENVFSDRTVQSGDENIISAQIKRGAQPVDVEVKVDRMAKADRMFSDELPEDFSVAAGSYAFKVGEKDIVLNYSGGNLADFARRLGSIAPNDLKASVINSSPKKQTLFLEGQKTGADNKIDFLDAARPFAFNAGLVTDRSEPRFTVESDNRGLPSGQTIDLSKSLRLPPGRLLSARLAGDTPSSLKAGSYLSLNYKLAERASEQTVYAAAGRSASAALREGRLLPEQRASSVALPQPAGSSLFLRVNNSLVPLAKLDGSSGEPDGKGGYALKIDLSRLQGEAQAVVLRNAGSSADIETSDITLYMPGDAQFRAKNPASSAQDASLTVDGVRVTRPTNEIDDLLPDYTFTVKGESSETIKLSVRNNVEEASAALQDFVWFYNINMARINIITSLKDNQAVIDEISYFDEGQREQAQKELGAFVSNQQFLQAKNRLHLMMTSPYTVGKDGTERFLLSDLGISTNASGQGAMGNESSRRGYFEINTKQLEAALNNNWESVKDFFSRDSDNDYIQDEGLAVSMEQYLRQFTSLSGFIRQQTTQLDAQIKRQNEAIDNFNEDLERKRKRWEQDFAKAESAEAEMRRLNQQMNSSNNSN